MGRSRRQIEFALRFWLLTRLAKRLGHLPPFRWVAGLVASDKSFRGSFVPVGEEVEAPPGLVAPRDFLLDCLSRASHMTIVHRCPCRSGEGCERHPVDIGCILMGEGSRQVDPGVGCAASLGEAAAHLDLALASGLLPMLGNVRIDRAVFGVRGPGALLSMCFCCNCCCVVRSGMRRLAGAFPESLVKLEGVSVEVTGDCVGCGECLPLCPVENISLEGGVAVIGERCLGCGTCARTCARGSISVKIRPGAQIYEDLERRIGARSAFA